MEQIYFHLPTKIFFGSNSLERNLPILSSYGKKILIVTGKQSAQKSGLLQKIERILRQEGLAWQVFNDVPPEPDTSACEKGAEAALSFGADLILGVGGGSPLDVAKAIAVLAVNQGKTSDYFGEDAFTLSPLPVIAIPTTCGTGSEITKYAVIIDEKERTKKTISSEKIIPAVAIVDPDLLKTLPSNLIAGSGMDALAHAIEGFLSKKSNSLTRIWSIESIQLVKSSLIHAIEKREGSLETIMLASLFAGFVINHTGTIMVHGMGYPLTINYQLHHGTANALMLPYVLQFLKTHGYAEEIKTISAIVSPKEIASLTKKSGLPSTLAEINISNNDINRLAQEASIGCERSFKNMKGPFSIAELAAIYLQAWEGKITSF
jgi:alcohol dehydrogenase